MVRTEEIKILMKLHKVSYAELGKLLDLHRNSVLYKLNGKTQFLADEISRIARYFGVDITKLLD